VTSATQAIKNKELHCRIAPHLAERCYSWRYLLRT
jgi:hypothetical protein